MLTTGTEYEPYFPCPVFQIAESNMQGRKLSTLKEWIDLLVTKGFRNKQFFECTPILMIHPWMVCTQKGSGV